MATPTTLLITAPSPQLLAELARKRPDWTVVPLVEWPPARWAGSLWGFIDWLCPTMSGLEMCRRLRELEPTRHAHLTMVLDDADIDARRRSLQAGADDYLVGPLDAALVIDRVDRLAGDAGVDAGPAHHRITNGAIAIDLCAHQARVNGAAIALPPTEFRLLAHFMEHPDQIFSRSALIDCLGRNSGDIDDRTVDVWVGRLRRALAAHGAPDPLRTVRSLGYILDSQ